MNIRKIDKFKLVKKSLYFSPFHKSSLDVKNPLIFYDISGNKGFNSFLNIDQVDPFYNERFERTTKWRRHWEFYDSKIHNDRVRLDKKFKNYNFIPFRNNFPEKKINFSYFLFFSLLNISHYIFYVYS